MSEETINIIDKKKGKTFGKRERIWGGICIALIGIGYSFISVIWSYPDTIEKCRWSCYLWEVLSAGKITDYYDYLYQQGKWCDISWLSSLLQSLWSFPLWIFVRISGQEHVLFSILYTKAFLCLCLVALCIFVYRIVLLFRKDDNQSALIASLFVAASLEILDSVGYAGQDEIVYLLFYVIGLFFLIKQKHFLCLVFFTFSVTACPIMIIPIFCNYLVYYKKLFKLLFYTIILILPSILFELVYAHDPSWQMEKTKNTLGTFQTMMTTGTITSSVGPVPIAFVVIVIVAILSYFTKKDEEKRDIKCVRYSAVVFFALSFLTSVTFYRYCIYVPIFAILFGINDKSLDLKGFLLFFIGILRFGYSLINGCNMEYRFLSNTVVKIFGEKVLTGGTDACIINRHSTMVDSAFCMARPVIIGCSILYLYLCFKDSDDLEFPMKVKTTVMLSSVMGIALVTFTLFQIMTSFR